MFQDTDAGYWFFANSAREADEWIKILNCARLGKDGVIEGVGLSVFDVCG